MLGLFVRLLQLFLDVLLDLGVDEVSGFHTLEDRNVGGEEKQGAKRKMYEMMSCTCAFWLRRNKFDLVFFSDVQLNRGIFISLQFEPHGKKKNNTSVGFCSYPVQSAERHINGQREQVLDHFLESFHQLLLIGFDLLRLKAQEDPHGDAEHEPLHLRIDQHAGVLGEPLLHRSPHLLLDYGDVVLQSLPGEGLHDGLERKGKRKVRTCSSVQFEKKSV